MKTAIAQLVARAVVPQGLVDIFAEAGMGRPEWIPRLWLILDFGTQRLRPLSRCLAGGREKYGFSVFAYAPGVVRTAMVEYVAYSPEVHESIRDPFLSRLEEGSDTPMERAVEMFMFLASGKADALSGCHIKVNDDESELIRRAEEIRRDDLYTLRHSEMNADRRERIALIGPGLIGHGVSEGAVSQWVRGRRREARRPCCIENHPVIRRA